MKDKIKAAILRGLEAIQANSGRVIGILSVLVLAPLAAALTDWLGRHFPGVHVGAQTLEAAMAAAVLGAIAYGISELRGHHQEKQAGLDRASTERVAALQSTGHSAEAAKRVVAQKVVDDVAASAPEGSSTS